MFIAILRHGQRLKRRTREKIKRMKGVKEALECD